MADYYKKNGFTITTKDPMIALRTITTRSCRTVHTIADLMREVIAIKDNFKIQKEFRSARTPELCDDILKNLVYMLECEANCGVEEAGFINEGNEVALPDYGYEEEKQDEHALAP